MISQLTDRAELAYHDPVVVETTEEPLDAVVQRGLEDFELPNLAGDKTKLSA
jgi:hypothetical protein